MKMVGGEGLEPPYACKCLMSNRGQAIEVLITELFFDSLYITIAYSISPTAQIQKNGGESWI